MSHPTTSTSTTTWKIGDRCWDDDAASDTTSNTSSTSTSTSIAPTNAKNEAMHSLDESGATAPYFPMIPASNSRITPRSSPVIPTTIVSSSSLSSSLSFVPSTVTSSTVTSSPVATSSSSSSATPSSPNENENETNNYYDDDDDYDDVFPDLFIPSSWPAFSDAAANANANSNANAPSGCSQQEEDDVVDASEERETRFFGEGVVLNTKEEQVILDKARDAARQATYDKRWESMFQLLVRYKAQHGNTWVPTKYPKNPQFGRWVKTQRGLHSREQLVSHRVLRLDSVGFTWSTRKRQIPWVKMFQVLLEYKAQHGNTLVPIAYANNPKLGTWVNEQRLLHLSKELTKNRMSRLESIGFVWKIQVQVPWETMFQQLQQYKAQHGNTLVPKAYANNPQLGKWVSEQLQLQSRNQLSSDRVSCLESIGFVWQRQRQLSWESMFQMLLQYKAQHGNTMVPCDYPKNAELGRWVSEQRRLYSRNQLSSNHILRFESIGFVCCARRLLDVAKWESMFRLLQQYKAQHGNTMVPCFYKRNATLGNWVRTQRYTYSKNKISRKRVARLD